MTQTMLERAARAAWDAVCATNDEKSGGYAGTMHKSSHYVDGFVDPSAIARAVLMAVREPDEDLVGWVCGQYAREFTFMIDAILNEPQP